VWVAKEYVYERLSETDAAKFSSSTGFRLVMNRWVASGSLREIQLGANKQSPAAFVHAKDLEECVDEYM
jgi:hypothetical protein